MHKYTWFAALGTISTVLNMAVAFVSVPLLMHYLTISSYGNWVLFNSLGLLVSIVGSGLPQAMIKFVAQDPKTNFIVYMRLALRLTLAVACISELALMIPRGYILHLVGIGDTSVLRTAYTLFVISWVVSLFVNLTSALLISIDQHSKNYVISMWVSLVSITAQWLVLRSAFGLRGLALVVISIGMIRLIANVWIIRRWILVYRPSNGTKLETAMLSEILRYSLYQIASQIAYGLIFNLDNIIAARYCGVQEMVSYSLRLKMFQTLTTATGQPFWNYIPLISRRNFEGDIGAIRTLMLQAMRISMSAVGLIAVFYAFYIDRFISIWTNHRLQQSFMLDIAFAFLLVLEQYLLNIVIVISGMDLRANKLVTYVSSIEALTNVVLTLIFTSKFGVVGVVLGTIVPRLLLNSVALTIIVLRRTQMGISKLIKSVSYPSVSNVLVILLLLALASWMSALNSVSFLLLTLGMGTVFMVALVLLSVEPGIRARLLHPGTKASGVTGTE